MPVLRVRKGVQTAAFLGPVAALTVLSNPSISPPLALLCMTAALGITSLGEWTWWGAAGGVGWGGMQGQGVGRTDPDTAAAVNNCPPPPTGILIFTPQNTQARQGLWPT